MIEKHVVYYKVNDPALYRSIIADEDFEKVMLKRGVTVKEILELENEEFRGVFEIDANCDQYTAFTYFVDKGVIFIMTRTARVTPIQAQKEMLQELDSIKSTLERVV